MRGRIRLPVIFGSVHLYIFESEGLGVLGSADADPEIQRCKDSKM
jgi:hypothetical protein